MCTDLARLNIPLDTPWIRYFPFDLTFNNQAVFTHNQPFKVPPVWTLKKTYETDLNTQKRRIFSQLPKQDFLVNLGTSDSAYLRLVSSLDINSYHHKNYPGKHKY